MRGKTFDVLEKPQNLPFEHVNDVIIQSHEAAKKRGVIFSNTLLSAEEKQAIITPEGQCFVAMDDDKVIGTISYSVESLNTWYCKSGKAAKLRFFAVLPDCQGNGVGTSLIRYAIESIKKNNMDTIVLSTLSNNISAIRLYKKMGFRLMRYYKYAEHHSVAMILKNSSISKFRCDVQYWCSLIKTGLKEIIPKIARRLHKNNKETRGDNL